MTSHVTDECAVDVVCYVPAFVAREISASRPNDPSMTVCQSIKRQVTEHNKTRQACEQRHEIIRGAVLVF